ncbi:MAG: hypothetical protein GY715_18420 [Planctomycetes bacterium]|nr:hypothetical protein [Planctomycetota bacterium]
MAMRDHALKVFVAGFAVMLAAVSGCTPWATYPPLEGATSIDNPTLHPIPDVMGEALWYVHSMDVDDPANTHGGGELVFNLPAGMPTTVYDKVITKLSGDARPMKYPSETAYHVTEIRVRGTHAEVDVIHPSASGAPELVTVKLRQEGFRGFGTVDTRRWRFVVSAPPPHYPFATEAAGEQHAGHDTDDVGVVHGETTPSDE